MTKEEKIVETKAFVDEAAFPIKVTLRDELSRQITSIHYGGGLSKREYFAGLAMQEMVNQDSPERSAKIAVEYADTLIAELEKTK